MRTEAPLLEAARNMDRKALVEIFDLYSSALYNYALRLCNDPLRADNIVGDVFAKLLEQWSSGHGPSTNLRSYLYETTYHLIIDEVRYSHREAPLEVVAVRRPERVRIRGRHDGQRAREQHAADAPHRSPVPCRLTDDHDTLDIPDHFDQPLANGV